MRFNVVTFYDERLRELGDATSAVAEDYARAFGYRFARHRLAVNKRKHPFWTKIEILKDELLHADYTLWLDADALIVRTTPLECLIPESASHLLLSKDKNGLCCGVMLLKRSRWTYNLLKTWLFLGDVDSTKAHFYEDWVLHDQTSLKCLVDNYPNLRKRISLIPETLVLNPESEYLDTAFIMHYWSSSKDIPGILLRVETLRTSGWSREAFYPLGDRGWAKR